MENIVSQTIYKTNFEAVVYQNIAQNLIKVYRLLINNKMFDFISVCNISAITFELLIKFKKLEIFVIKVLLNFIKNPFCIKHLSECKIFLSTTSTIKLMQIKLL